MLMSKFAQAVAFASLIQIGASSELCQDSSEYDSTADYSVTCIKYYDTLALATTACAAVTDADATCAAYTQDATDDDASVDTYYCGCTTTDVDTGCSITDPYYTITSTCADQASSWDYSSSTAETSCESSGASYDGYADVCCSGGSSICADYTSQLCSDDADYEPLNFAYGMCYQSLDTATDQASATALCDSDCDAFYFDYDADGSDEWVCYCTFFGACPIATDDIDLYYEFLCGDSYENWAYDSSKTQCQDSYADMTSYAGNCCSSDESICAGYCYSADSTVSSINTEGKEMVVSMYQVKTGDKILSLNTKTQEPTYEKVLDVRSGKSTGDFYEIEMVGHKGSSSHKIRATSHHEFPLCTEHSDPFNGKKDKKKSKSVSASNIKKGDCFVTPSGEKYVHKVTKQKSNKKDETYSLEVENSDIVFVGGVATHSEHYNKKEEKKNIKAQAKNKKEVKKYLRGEENKAGLGSSSFVEFVTNKKQQDAKQEKAKQAQLRDIAIKAIANKKQ